MSTILVTGGAGYIGSHIIEQLIKNKKKVIILDNLKTGNRILLNKKANFIKGDINDSKLLTKIVEIYKIKTIIHLAGLINVLESKKKKEIIIIIMF